MVVDLFGIRGSRCERQLNRLGGYIQLCELIDEIRPTTLMAYWPGVFFAFPEGFYGTRYGGEGTSKFIATLFKV